MSKQDRQGVRTPQDLERKYDLASLVGIKKAVKNSEESINKTNKTLEEFMESTLETIGDIQSQVDGNITTWFESGVPTLTTPPASEWTTDTMKNEHLGDLYYDQDTGYAYRFAFCDGSYTWITILDNDVAEALKIANEAKDTADGKRRVFVETPKAPYDVGDLWLYNDELYVCTTASTTTYNPAHFEKATKYTDDSALHSFVEGEYADDLQLINSQIDQKAETWYQSADPALNWTTADLKKLHVGDLWYNTTAKKNYLYTTSYIWQEVDGVPDDVYDQIDGKAQVFTAQPKPPYYVGDIYTQGSTGDILVCKTERLTGSFTESDWDRASKYTDDTSLHYFVDVTFAESMESLNELIDSKITTWYYSGVPTLSNLPASEWATNEEKTSHIGDLYYDKATGYTYRFMQGTPFYWEHIVDKDLTEALALANSASDTADSKRRVFVEQPAPPYDNGDLWFRDQEIYICQISKPEGETYAEKDFIIATKYTDDTLATQVGDNLEIVRGTVATIQEGVDAFKIDFETTIKSIDDRQQETIESMERMSYTFGTNDLHIAKSTDPVNTRINQQGLKVYTYNELQALFNHRGAGIQKLIVVGDAQLGNLSIVKAKDASGNDCTDINYLVSNVQTLHDLEGE